MDLSLRYRLSPEIGLRVEHFGGVLYHRGQGKMYLLRSPTLVALLCSLHSGRPAGEVVGQIVRDHALGEAEVSRVVSALEELRQMGVLSVV